MHRQPLIPQDDLTVELSGSGVGGDIETAALLVWYEELPGINGRFINGETLFASGVNTLSVDQTITTLATGDWTGEEAITAESDLLKANTDYAIPGYLASVDCGAVRWRGADFGNLGVGGPGDPDGRDWTASWFLQLSIRS